MDSKEEKMKDKMKVGQEEQSSPSQSGVADPNNSYISKGSSQDGQADPYNSDVPISDSVQYGQVDPYNSDVPISDSVPTEEEKRAAKKTEEDLYNSVNVLDTKRGADNFSEKGFVDEIRNVFDKYKKESAEEYTSTFKTQDPMGSIQRFIDAKNDTEKLQAFNEMQARLNEIIYIQIRKTTDPANNRDELFKEISSFDKLFAYMKYHSLNLERQLQDHSPSANPASSNPSQTGYYNTQSNPSSVQSQTDYDSSTQINPNSVPVAKKAGVDEHKEVQPDKNFKNKLKEQFTGYKNELTAHVQDFKSRLKPQKNAKKEQIDENITNKPG